MRLREILAGSAATALGLAIWGCGPPQIAPVAPPGVELTRVTVGPEEDPAEALGEAANSGRLDKPTAPTAVASEDSPPTEKGETRSKSSGLKYQTLKEGIGVGAKAGQSVSVHYTGSLANGDVFDSSRGKQPITLVLGSGQVIKGWDEGLQGMKVGERRQLTIPPELGYGSEGRPPKIPPDSTLIFDVELMKIE